MEEKEDEESREEPKPESLSVLRLEEEKEKDDEESLGGLVSFLADDLCGDSPSRTFPPVPLALPSFACWDSGKRTMYLLPGCCCCCCCALLLLLLAPSLIITIPSLSTPADLPA